MKNNTNEPTPPLDNVGPQRAAEAILEVEAVPDDGGASEAPGAEPAFDAVKEWREAVILAFGTSTNLLARKYPFWKLSEAELGNLGDAWAKPLARWFPNAMPDWLVALTGTAIMLGPRFVATAEYEHARKTGGDTGGPAQSASTPPPKDAHRDRGTGYPDRGDPQPS